MPRIANKIYVIPFTGPQFIKEAAVQFIATPGGEEVAVMNAREALVVEGALSLYVTQNPDPSIAARALREFESANESRQARVDEAVERASA